MNVHGGKDRVMRGGSFGNPAIDAASGARAKGDQLDMWGSALGMRVVLAPEIKID